MPANLTAAAFSLLGSSLFWTYIKKEPKNLDYSQECEQTSAKLFEACVVSVFDLFFDVS